MENFNKIAPIFLIKTLNSFNEKLESKRQEVELSHSEMNVKLEGNNYNKLIITYRIKHTGFVFNVGYVIKKDFMSWSFYPHSELSSSSTARSLVTASENIYRALNIAFDQWLSIILKTEILPNPLEHFKVDRFIKSYASEVLSHLSISPEEETAPVSIQNQHRLKVFFDKQLKFIELELKEEENENSEKSEDFKVAKTLLLEMKEEIPRMTAAEVKQKFTLSIAIIMKWCLDKFLLFIKLDSKQANDISRAIGSFVGGLLGIPKIDQ